MNAITFYKNSGGRVSTLPYDLPCGKIGKTEVSTMTKPIGEKLTVVGARNSIFMGLKQASVILTEPTVIHQLSDEDGVWMTSLPQEIEQCNRQIAHFKGSVLVGGLGIGLAVSLLERNPKVSLIVVLDNNPDVIALIKPHIPQSKTLFVCSDLKKYLLRCKKKNFCYEYAFFDTWRGTGEMSFAENVFPLREAAEGVIEQDNIECWNESEMHGQIRMSIQMWATIQFDYLIGIPQSQFLKWKRSMGVKFEFANWLRTKRPSEQERQDEVEVFMRLLKNPIFFKERYEA